MVPGAGASIGVATMRPRTSAVVSVASAIQSTAPLASAGTTAVGTTSPKNVIGWPAITMRLAVMETRVRVMSNHWKYDPSSPMGISPMRR